VRDAALYGIATLARPREPNKGRYSDATEILEGINRNQIAVYGP
jgi:hypothetical protein